MGPALVWCLVSCCDPFSGMEGNAVGQVRHGGFTATLGRGRAGRWCVGEAADRDATWLLHPAHLWRMQSSVDFHLEVTRVWSETLGLDRGVPYESP